MLAGVISYSKNDFSEKAENMIQIVVSSDNDIRYRFQVLLDEIFIGDGAIQAFSDPARVLKYAERNIKINQAYISYGFEPTGGINIGKMLKERQPDINLIFLVNEQEENIVFNERLPGATYIRDRISPDILKRI